MMLKPRVGIEWCTPDFKECRLCGEEKPTIEFAWRRDIRRKNQIYCSGQCYVCHNRQNLARQRRFLAKRMERVECEVNTLETYDRALNPRDKKSGPLSYQDV